MKRPHNAWRTYMQPIDDNSGKQNPPVNPTRHDVPLSTEKVSTDAAASSDSHDRQNMIIAAHQADPIAMRADSSLHWTVSNPADTRVNRRPPVAVLDTMLEILMLLLLVFTPIAFGATERWSRLTVTITITLMCALWCLRAIIMRKFSIVRSPLNVLILSFIVLASIQLVPLPDSVAGWLSPSAAFGERGTLAGSAEAAFDNAVESVPYSDEVSGKGISANPAAGKASLVMVICYAAAFLITINTFNTKAQFMRLIWAVVCTGFIVAMLGVLGKSSPPGKLLWLRDTPAGAIPFGPFVNRNHFAGYLVMTIALALGMMVSVRHREKKTLLAFASAVMIAALLASASRGGVISMAIGAAVFGAMLISSRSAKGNLIPLVMVGCLAAIGAAIVGVGPLLSRSAELLDAEAPGVYRWGVWKDTFRMFMAFPLLGVGLGAFSSIFPLFKTLPAQLHFSHVENDYLQLLAETGVIGFGIGVAFIVIIMRHAFRNFTANRSSASRGMIIGLTSAAAGLLAHSFVDFNLHVTSNGLLFAFILASLAVLSSMHAGRSGFAAKPAWIGPASQRPLKGDRLIAPGAFGALSLSTAVLCVMAFLAAAGANNFIAERDLNRVEKEAMEFISEGKNFHVAGAIEKMQEAVRRDTRDPQWHFKTGLMYQTLGQLKVHNGEAAGSAGVKQFYRMANQHLTMACSLDRFNSYYHTMLAVSLSESGRLDEADAAFRVAVNLNPTSSWTYHTYGLKTWHVDRPKSAMAFRQALSLEPSLTRNLLNSLLPDTSSLIQLASCVPAAPEAQYEFALFLIFNNAHDQAEKVLLALLPQVTRDSTRYPLAADVYFRLGQIRQDQGLEEDAVALFLKAVSLQPDRPAYYEHLGYACLKQQRYEEARRYLERRLQFGSNEDGNLYLALGEVFENTGVAHTAHQYYRRALDLLPPSWDVSRRKAVSGMNRTAEF